MLVFLLVTLVISWAVAHRYYLVTCGRVICKQEVDGCVARIRQYNKSILPDDGYFYALEVVWPRRGITPAKILSSFFLNLDSYTARDVGIKSDGRKIHFTLDAAHTYFCVLNNPFSCVWQDTSIQVPLE
jgi:hypothetical protein